MHNRSRTLDMRCIRNKLKICETGVILNALFHLVLVGLFFLQEIDKLKMPSSWSSYFCY